MAYIDTRSGELVLHIVYDGLASAGKTTNVRALHTRLLAGRDGEVESPGSSGRETELFDWREFSGGYLDDLKLRCLILSVPGQAHRAVRRRFILERADVAVFVLDAGAQALEENRAAVRSLAAALDGPDVPVILQINKGDLLGDASPAELVSALRLAPTTPFVVACAKDGVGVSDTFLLAVRAAAQRARDQRARGALRERSLPSSADELAGLMRARE